MLEKSRNTMHVAGFGSAIDQLSARPAAIVIGRVQPFPPSRIAVGSPPARDRLIKLLFQVLPRLLAQPSLQGLVLLLKGADLGPQRFESGTAAEVNKLLTVIFNVLSIRRALKLC
jgi:hypothetical protein